MRLLFVLVTGLVSAALLAAAFGLSTEQLSEIRSLDELTAWASRASVPQNTDRVLALILSLGLVAFAIMISKMLRRAD